MYQHLCSAFLESVMCPLFHPQCFCFMLLSAKANFYKVFIGIWNVCVRTKRMWGVIQADLEAPRDPAELVVFLGKAGVRNLNTLEMLENGPPVLPGGARAGCLDCDWPVSPERGLMKTNDLTGSKGWDQGCEMPRPSQFSTREMNEGREQQSVCIIYPSLPPWPRDPSVSGVLPTCWPIKTPKTQPE